MRGAIRRMDGFDGELARGAPMLFGGGVRSRAPDEPLSSEWEGVGEAEERATGCHVGPKEADSVHALAARYALELLGIDCASAQAARRE